MFKFKKIISLITATATLLSFPVLGKASPLDNEVYSSNLVENGSFEEGDTGWKNWTGNFAVTDETAFDGGYSAKIWANNSGDNEQFLQNVKVLPGKTYTFSMWIRVPSGQSVKTSLLLTGNGYPQTALSTMWATYDSADYDNYFTPNKVDGSKGDGHTAWKELTATITIPSEAQFTGFDESNSNTYPNLCIYIQYSSGGNWNRYVYIDNVNLQRVYADDDIVRSYSFKQNGEDITDTGFNYGTVKAEITIDSVRVNGHIPFVLIALYDGNEMVGYSYATNYGVLNDDGTITISASIDVDENEAQYGYSISAFVWSDISSMISLSDTFSIGQI